MKIEIKTYLVFAECDYTEEREDLGDFDNLEDANFEFKNFAESFSETGSTFVYLQEKIDIYSLNEQMLEEDEFDLIDVYDLENQFINLDYFEIEEEGDFENVDEREIKGSEIESENLESEIWSFLMKKYKWSGLNYRTAKINGKSVKIRLKNHSANPARMDNETLSIVVRIDNKTAKWSNNNEVVIEGGTDFDDAIIEIKEKINEIF